MELSFRASYFLSKDCCCSLSVAALFIAADILGFASQPAVRDRGGEVLIAVSQIGSGVCNLGNGQFGGEIKWCIVGLFVVMDSGLRSNSLLAATYYLPLKSPLLIAP